MKALAVGCWGVVVWTALAGTALWPAAAGAEETTEAASRQYNAAVALQNKGVYDLAAEEWVKFIDTYRGDSRLDRAFHWLGVCYLQNRQLEAAQQCFETVVKSFPKFEQIEATYLYLGVTRFKRAQAEKAEKADALYDSAAAALDTLLRGYPASKYLAQALFYRGDCAYHRGKKAEAAAFYAQAAAKSPDEKLLASILYALGVAQEEVGQPAEAGKTYDQFLKKFPDSPQAAEVIMRRGETLFAAAEYPAAAQWFAAAAARPGFGMADYATLRQAVALAHAQKYDEAADLLAAIPARFPGSAQAAAARTACHALVLGLLKEKRPADALRLLEKVLPTAAGSPEAARLLVDQADAIADIPERHAEAMALYAAVAARYPQDAVAPQALYLAGYGALAQGDFAAALRYADAFLAAYPKHELLPDVLFVSAESRLQLGRYPEAEQLYGQLLASHPQHADAELWKVRRGTALHLQKKDKEAIALLEPLVAQLHNPDARAEAYYLIGSGQIEEEQFAAAAKSLEASLAAQPKWRQADETLFVLAHAYYRQKLAAQAKDTLNKLIAAFPASKVLDRAHYRLGELAAAAGDQKSAATEYRLVLQSWPESPVAPRALDGLGWALFDQNDFAAAETAFNTLVEKHPQAAWLSQGRYGRGMARHQLGKFAEAVADFQTVLAAPTVTQAEKSDARYILGLCQVGLKQPDQAVAVFQALLQEDPKYAAADKVLFELAWALKSLGKEAEATAALAQLVKEHPDSPHAAESRFYVGEAAYKAGNFQQAAAAYSAAIEKAGKTELGEKAAHKLGWAHYRLDNPADAHQAFAYQRANWPQGPWAADAAFMEAECLFKQKKYAEALAAYAQVKNPSSKDFQVLTLLHTAEALGQIKSQAEPERAKNWQKSVELLDRCVKEFADSAYLPDVMYERGWALQNLGKNEEALGEYAAVLAKTSGEAAARAQFMIGEIQFQQKKHAEAVKSFFLVLYGYAIRNGRPMPPTRPPAASRSSRKNPRPSSSTRSWSRSSRKATRCRWPSSGLPPSRTEIKDNADG
jgi:TolA-binding protein